MRLRFIYLTILALVLIVLPAAAQDSTQGWFVYLFDGINHDLIRVDQDGAMDIFSLDIGENEYANQYDMTFTNDGSTVVFCKESRPDPNDPNPGMKTLIVRDIASEANTLELPIAQIPGCTVSALSPDETQVAVGTVSIMPFSEQAVPEGLPEWRLQIIDIGTGAVINEISNETEGMPPFDKFGEGIPLLARVIEWTEDTITFVGLPFVGMDGPASLPAYQWTIADGTVTLIDDQYSTFGDTLPQTGERVTPILDETVPAAMPGGPLPQANTVTITDGNGTRPIYRNEDWVIVDADFVNDGQAIAVQLLKGFNMDNPTDISTMRYALVDRAGNVTELAGEYESAAQIAPVPGGALILWSENPTEQTPMPIAHLSFVQNGVASEIWSYAPEMQGGFTFLQFAWFPPVTTEGELPAFPSLQ